MEIKVSVILACDEYNTTFHRLLCSLNEQTLQEIEVIIVCKQEEKKLVKDIEWLNKKCIKIIISKEIEEKVGSKEYMRVAVQAKGEYILYCSDSMYFEAGTLEDLYKNAVNYDVDIIQYQIRFIPSMGVTNYQANEQRKLYLVYNGLLENEEIMKQSIIHNKISMSLIGKMVKRNLISRAFKYINIGECCYEEVIWIYVIMNCNRYMGLTSRIYATIEVQEKDILELDANDFKVEANKKTILNQVEKLFSEKRMGEDIKLYIQETLYIKLLREVITLWASNRCPDDLKKESILIILNVWGPKDTICGLASWAKNSRDLYSQSLMHIFQNFEKKNYKRIAVFDEEWTPFNEDDKIVEIYRFGNNKNNISNNKYFYLPPPKGVLWYKERYEIIEKAINQKNIDVVCFKNCKNESTWDILATKICGAHVVIDDRKVKEVASIYKQNDVNSYMRFVWPMKYADVVIVPKWADVTNFSEMGIKYTYDYEIDKVLNCANKVIDYLNSSDITLYEERILRKKYYQDEIKYNQMKKVIGPYENAIYRSNNINIVKKGIRNALWKEKLLKETLFGKIELIVKTILKITILPEISLGIQNYHTRPKLGFKKAFKKIFNIGKIILHPTDIKEKIKLRKKRELYCEKRMSLGNKNPNKTFYLIRISPGNEGLLLSYLFLLRIMEKFEETNIIPIIDMQWTYYLMAHNDVKEQGKINAWEKYFRQYDDYKIEEVYQSKNIIRGQVIYRDQSDNYFRLNILKEQSQEGMLDFKKWCYLNNKYIRLNEDLVAQFEEEFQKIIGQKRTIGVMVREGYRILNQLNYALVSNHAIQPDFEEVVNDLNCYLKLWKCEQIYISAEYEETIRFFTAHFNKKIVYTKRKRKDFSATEADEYRKKRDDYYLNISREEINVDYLKEVYLLSKCTNLLAGRASASIVAALWNINMKILKFMS